MGDPKKLRKKYQTPSHPWQKARIEEEKILTREYGLKNKTEIWRMVSLLKEYHKLAKKLVALHTKQAEIEKKALISKLVTLGLLKPDAEIHNVLEINIKDVMERRLQTILVKKGLARTVRQSRQFITHGHIVVDGKKIDSPAYLVTQNELSTIKFNTNSNIADDNHPERVVVEKIKEVKNEREE